MSLGIRSPGPTRRSARCNLPLHCQVTFSYPSSTQAHYKKIVTGSAEAIGRLLQFGQHTTQHCSVKFAHDIDNLLTTYPGLTLTIQQANRDPTLVGFKRARHLILDVIKRTRNPTKVFKSIKFQRAESKSAALHWLQAREYRSYDTPCSSQAYDSAPTSPPDGRPHTILRMAPTGIRIKGKKYVHHVPRDVQFGEGKLGTEAVGMQAFRPHRLTTLRCRPGLTPRNPFKISFQVADTHSALPRCSVVPPQGILNQLSILAEVGRSHSYKTIEVGGWFKHGVYSY